MKKIITALMISGFLFGGTVLTIDQLPTIEKLNESDTITITSAISNSVKNINYEEWTIKSDSGALISTDKMFVGIFKITLDKFNNTQFNVDEINSLIPGDWVGDYFYPSNSYIYSIRIKSATGWADSIEVVYKRYITYPPNLLWNWYSIIIQPDFVVLDGFNAGIDDIRLKYIKGANEVTGKIDFYAQSIGASDTVTIKLIITYMGE